VGLTLASGVAITPDGKFVYVAALSGSVAVIDTASNMIVASIPVVRPA
jgi:YVTN family beta-propeller protein